jgi:hypothetical protein
MGDIEEAKRTIDIVLDKYPNDPSVFLLKKGIEKMTDNPNEDSV